MLSTEFFKIFESFPNFKASFLGCFSADNLPKKIKTNCFCIINTDISTGAGIHWYVIFRYSYRTLELFDSLGVDESKKDFIKQNLKISGVKEVEYNSTQFQKNDTDTCGHFVIYFIVNRLYNLDHSFHDLLEEIFNKNLDINEEEVKNFYKDI